MNSAVNKLIYVFLFTLNCTFTGRQTSQNNSDNASTYSDNKSGNSDSTRKKGIKVKSESRKQPPRHQKGKTRQVYGLCNVAWNNNNRCHNYSGTSTFGHLH